jgi:Flp pilus assembly CpaE family ATPase
MNPPSAQQNSRLPNRSFAVVAATSGIGVTTFATNLAFALAHPKIGLVALAEIESGVPELALNLDVEPKAPLSRQIHDWKHIDGSVLRQAGAECGGGVLVMGESAGSIKPVTPPAEGAGPVMTMLKQEFAMSVIDLGHGSVTPVKRAVMQAATDVIILFRLDVPTIRRTKSLISEITCAQVPPGRLRLIANRYGQPKSLSWSRAQDAVRMPITDYIPDDPSAANAALNHAKPLVKVAGWSKITKQFAACAKKLLALPTE